MIALGLVIVVAMVLLEYVGYNAPNQIPGRSYYTLHVDFTNADQLSAHYQVRIAGRLVGQVVNPRVVHGQAIADLQLTPDIAPLRSDTTLQARPRSVIGIRFVEIHPGAQGSPLPNGGWITATHTSATVPLDRVLDMLDAPRRAEFQSFMRGMGEGFLTRGSELNDVIAQTPTLLANTAAAFGATNANPGAWQRLVAASEGAAAAAQPVRDDIRAGFAPEAHDMRIFADHAAALRKLLDTAPASLSGIRAGLGQSDAMVTQLDALARAASPTLRQAPQAFTELTSMLRVGGPNLDAADQTIQLADQAVHPTLSLLSNVRPVIPSLRRALTTGLPIFDVLAPRSCDVDHWFVNWRGMVDHGPAGQSGPLGPFNVLRIDELVSAGSLNAIPHPAALNPQADPYPAPCQAARDIAP
jgi:phospholipid/cholesterol/gamma-HCH transport system substrate-binding protein